MADGRTELCETNADVLALPIFIVVILLAIVIRQGFTGVPSSVVLWVCAGAAVADVAFARFLLLTGRATIVVTADRITFTPRQGRDFKGAKPQTLERVPGSTLRFRVQSAGFIGTQIRYVLRLCDTATGNEIALGPFGRRRVRQACTAQGWPFA